MGHSYTAVRLGTGVTAFGVILPDRWIGRRMRHGKAEQGDLQAGHAKEICVEKGLQNHHAQHQHGNLMQAPRPSQPQDMHREGAENQQQGRTATDQAEVVQALQRQTVG